MAMAKDPVVPGLIPEPREINALGDTVECGKTVNLVADGALASRLQALSVLLASMDQLENDLTEVQSGARSPDDVRWYVE